MLTEEQIKNLKQGDKLIFISDSGVLMGRPGDVITFNNWYFDDYEKRETKHYFQCKELLEMYNRVHSFATNTIDVFDENKYKTYRLLNKSIIYDIDKKFVEQFGND